MFHISLLKKYRGDPLASPISLPSDFHGSQPLLLPQQILGFRRVLQQGYFIPKVLIQWQTQSPDEVTWEPLCEFKQDFPTFNLEDKVSLEGEDNVASPTIMDRTPIAQ